MKLRHLFFMLLTTVSMTAFGQTYEESISKLNLNKKEKKYFNNRDSAIVLHIDTLIMKDKSSLQFIGKKNVRLIVKHAELGKGVFFSGTGRQNDASDFDIDINFSKLGSLYVIARGQDAINGTRTFPNGNGGTVKLTYSANGITPQTTDKKSAQYLYVDASAGGRTTNPSSDLSQIYSTIARSAPGLRGVPQGQIYSGSLGKEGTIDIQKK
ncbi:hypothetical protein [Sphingobacterium sp. LRF_L2]|uniref:hypothetical protein n=1 Tax=Sphingobacterium sp. LRF_L2 TaxID=3369421 RepID=UPI003F61CBFD